MKAISIKSIGKPDVLNINDIPKPKIMENDEVLVKLKAAGVNPIDTKLRSGAYPIDNFPAVLGCDGAGIVEEIGSKVDKVKKGDSVFFFHGGIGGVQGNYAQYKVVFQDCYNSSDIKMKIRFYTDATSGNNGTLVTSSNYSYTGGRIAWNSTAGPTMEAGNASHFYPYTTAAGDSAEIYTGELIFPMKTSGYNDAVKCYGTMLAHNYYWPMISCELQANPTHFLTGIHIYFIEKNNTNPLSPTTGRITLLRMKYS